MFSAGYDESESPALKVASLLAFLSALLYFADLAVPMWLPELYATPHLDTPKLLGVSETTMTRFTLVVITQFVIYLAVFRISVGLSSVRSAAMMVSLAGLAALPLLMMYPGGAGDVYAYIAEADSVLSYHANPFLTPVADIPGHPLLPFLDYPRETTHYGPLWLAIGVLLRLLSRGDLLAGIITFKVAALALLLASGWLVYLILRKDRQEAAIPGAVMVVWNPLLLFELAGNGHNDVAMAFLVVLAFYFYNRSSSRRAVTALLAAFLVKYTAIVLMPLFLLAMLRQAGSIRSWLAGAIIYGGGTAAIMAAVVSVTGLRGTLGVLDDQTRWFTTSPAATSYFWLVENGWMLGPEAARVVTRGGQMLFGALYLVEMLRLWFRPRSLAESSFRVVMLLLLLVVSWFQPWYVTWAIPLGTLAGAGGYYAAAIGLSFGGFMVHTVMGFAWRLEWNRGSLMVIHGAGAATTWAPAIAGSASTWVLTASSRLRRGIAGAIVRRRRSR